LQELARRQQALEEQRKTQQTAAQKWEQERLKRDAEELARKLDQLCAPERIA